MEDLENTMKAFLEAPDSNAVHVQMSSSSSSSSSSVSLSVGVDEAGRGPVLGPMVYAAYASLSESSLSSTGAADSKTLDESKREELLPTLLGSEYNAGLAIKIISPSFITRSMYRRSKYNLNTISHDAAIELVQTLLNRGLAVNELFVDTVGPPDKYQSLLEKHFPDINKIVVSKKADAKYPCVSAASICAKVVRDRVLKMWEEKEQTHFGSGYPGDPVTKKYLNDNMDDVFGFNNVVRASWKTAEKVLNDGGIEMIFEELDPQEEDEDEGRGGKRRKQTKLNKYFCVKENGEKDEKKTINNDFQHIFFKERNIRRQF